MHSSNTTMTRKSMNKPQGNSGTMFLSIINAEESKTADNEKNADNSRCSDWENDLHKDSSFC